MTSDKISTVSIFHQRTKYQKNILDLLQAGKIKPGGWWWCYQGHTQKFSLGWGVDKV